MPESRDPVLSPAATARMVTACMARFDPTDVENLAWFGVTTAPLAHFMKLMAERDGEFRILRRGDDLTIEDEDGQPRAIQAGPDDGVWALVKMRLATWAEGGMLRLAEHPPDDRRNLAPARRVPEESRPGLRVDFDFGSNDNDF